MALVLVHVGAADRVVDHVRDEAVPPVVALLVRPLHSEDGELERGIVHDHELAVRDQSHELAHLFRRAVGRVAVIHRQVVGVLAVRPEGQAQARELGPEHVDLLLGVPGGEPLVALLRRRGLDVEREEGRATELLLEEGLGLVVGLGRDQAHLLAPLLEPIISRRPHHAGVPLQGHAQQVHPVGAQLGELITGVDEVQVVEHELERREVRDVVLKLPEVARFHPRVEHRQRLAVALEQRLPLLGPELGAARVLVPVPDERLHHADVGGVEVAIGVAGHQGAALPQHDVGQDQELGQVAVRRVDDLLAVEMFSEVGDDVVALGVRLRDPGGAEVAEQGEDLVPRFLEVLLQEGVALLAVLLVGLVHGLTPRLGVARFHHEDDIGRNQAQCLQAGHQVVNGAVHAPLRRIDVDLFPVVLNLLAVLPVLANKQARPEKV